MATNIQASMVTTAFALDGYMVVHNLGLVRGVAVRSRSALGITESALRRVFGGALPQIANLSRRVREDALDEMLVQAAASGADAIIGVRYATSDIKSGISEAICYGTAVKVQPAQLHA